MNRHLSNKGHNERRCTQEKHCTRQAHLQRSTASGARCKQRRRVCPGAAIKLPMCNGNINSTHTGATRVLREFHSALLLGLSSSSFSNLMVSPFMPSTSSPNSSCRWTCDRAWEKENTTPRRGRSPLHQWVAHCKTTSSLPSVAGRRRSCCLSSQKQLRVACLDSFRRARLGRAARTMARRRWGRARERRTPGSRKPTHVAERQLEAFPDEPEEQHVDVLRVIPHPLWR